MLSDDTEQNISSVSSSSTESEERMRKIEEKCRRRPQRPLRGRQFQMKYEKDFDSTLGYPGEGPTEDDADNTPHTVSLKKYLPSESSK